jgi:hypothetical protein
MVEVFDPATPGKVGVGLDLQVRLCIHRALLRQVRVMIQERIAR